MPDVDRDRIIQVMLAFCIFSKPADNKPKNMERGLYETMWRLYEAAKGNEYNHIREEFWPKVDLNRVVWCETADSEGFAPTWNRH